MRNALMQKQTAYKNRWAMQQREGNQNETQEIKIYIVAEIKNAFDGLSRRQGVASEIISELKYINGNCQNLKSNRKKPEKI